MFQNKELMLRIKKKRLILKNAEIELKKHFVGIDHIIHSVIKNSEIWYVLPELCTKPTTINLWGLTGVGKTDLVRRFVKLIGYNNRFCEIQLTNKGDANRPFHSTISSILSSSPSIKSSEPCILLLDEIQRFRTINEEGNELHDYKFQDIWSLLSDGKLPFESDMDYLLQLMFDFKKDEIAEKQDQLLAKSGKLKKTEETPNSNPKPNIYPASAKVVSEDEDEEIIDELLHDQNHKRNEEFITNYYCLERFKKILRLKEPIEEIALWDKAKKRQIISERLNDSTFYEEEDYSKLLIFISGNLDEAFRGQAHQTEEVDIDADTFHKESLKINVLNIKTALKSKFKPEQIARFGNVHIIYPSLSKKSYQKIIRRRISSAIIDIETRFKVKISIDNSIEKLIYDNGVYPTQGTRPVFSTISEIVDSNIPQFLFHAFLNNCKKVIIYYESKKICANVAGKVYRVPYVGSIDKIKDDRNDNRDMKMLIAVHESGHAVVYASLFGVSPTQINSNLASNLSGGFIGSHPVDHSEELYINRIISCMGGTVAEEIIFGVENKYEGSGGDIQNATNCAASLIRKLGMKGSSVFVSKNEHYEDAAYTNFTPSDKQIKKVVCDCKERARDILMDRIDLLRDTVEHLFAQGAIEPDEFKAICAKYGLKIKTMDAEYSITPKYVDLYSHFKKI